MLAFQMLEFIYKWRFSLLLAAVVLNILLVPLLASINTGPTDHTGSILIDLAFTLLLVVLVFTAGHNKTLKISYVLLALAALVFSWANLGTSNHEIDFYRNLFSFSALSVAMVLVIVEVFSDDCVTMDTISGALCAYLLLGLTFTSIYAFIDIIQPGSFISTVNATAVDLSSDRAGLDRIYFSFITLLTVGYGDITPLSHAAKLFTIIEGFFGQVYLVVMIARLVGMHVSQRSNHS